MFYCRLGSAKSSGTSCSRASSEGSEIASPVAATSRIRSRRKVRGARRRRHQATRYHPSCVPTSPAGSTVRRFHRVAVDPADAEVRFTLSWREPNDATGMVVVDPLGRTYPLAGSPLVREQRGARHHVLEVLDPLSGVWVIGERIAGDPGPTKFTASVAGDLEWSVDPRFDLFHPDEDLVLRVALGAGAGAVPVSQVTASFLSPSDQVTEVQGRQAGEGVFEVALPAPVEPGTWRASVAAFGMLVCALLHRVKAGLSAAHVLGVSLAASYVSAVVVNSTRVAIAMWLAAHPAMTSTIGADAAHRIEGIAVYFGGLVLLYEIVQTLAPAVGRR